MHLHSWISVCKTTWFLLCDAEIVVYIWDMIIICQGRLGTLSCSHQKWFASIRQCCFQYRNQAVMSGLIRGHRIRYALQLQRACCTATNPSVRWGKAEKRKSFWESTWEPKKSRWHCRLHCFSICQYAYANEKQSCIHIKQWYARCLRELMKFRLGTTRLIKLFRQSASSGKVLWITRLKGLDFQVLKLVEKEGHVI